MRVAFLAILLSSCVVNSRVNSPTIMGPVPSPSASPEQKIITLICDEKCTEAEKDKLKKVEAKLNETLGSKCFEDYMTQEGRKYTHFKDSPADIVKKMREPQTMLVNYYTSVMIWVLGYEVGGESVVHLNRLAVAYHGFNICDEASVAAHETSHAKGFMHLGNDPSKNDNIHSVPYQINAAFDSGPGKGGCCK